MYYCKCSTLFILYPFLGEATMHEREARDEKNSLVVTPLFMLFQSFAWRTVFADLLL